MDIDGPYYSVLNFFDRAAKLERIINVGDLTMATVKRPNDGRGARSISMPPARAWSPITLATTFFSHDIAPPAPAPKTGNAPAPRP